MKKIILVFVSLFILSSAAQAQYLPGIFYHDIGYPSDVTGTACMLDSSFYIIRYGGVQRFSSATGSVDYLWNRFYPAQQIVPAPDSSLALLKNGLVYRYYPAGDSMANISDSLPAATVTCIGASRSAIWGMVEFNELGRYTDAAGWQINVLGSSFNPTHILAVNDSSLYMADYGSVRRYDLSTGLSAILYDSSIISYLTEWAVDTSGNLWFIAAGQLIMLTPGGAVTYYNNNNSNAYFTNDVSHIAIDKYGSVWVCAVDLYKFSGNSWTYISQFNSSNGVEALTADPISGNLFIQSDNSIYILNGNTISNYVFGNMPYQHIKAASSINIATDQGIFDYQQTDNLTPLFFSDTSAKPYANDVTCIVVNNDILADSAYGTHHGVFNALYTVNNSQLPDTMVSCLYYSSGSYYIGTDKGLCIFNGTIYTTYDTSNTPLPSDNITFVTSYQSPYTGAQELWIGTDQGAMLYTNGVWSRYDTSVVHMSGFYVTGILPCPFYFLDPDSAVWISTLGNGLVKLKRDGTYTLFNTGNGLMPDDSLYYVSQVSECQFLGTVFIGTQSHGIAFLYIVTDTFQYEMSGNGNGGVYNFTQSKLYSALQSSYYYGGSLMVTDNGINSVNMCYNVGVKTTPADPATLRWYQMDDERLRVTLPDSYTGQTVFELYDMTGRKVVSSSQDVPGDGNVYLGIAALSPGVYVLHASDSGHSSQTKLVISK